MKRNYLQRSRPPRMMSRKEAKLTNQFLRMLLQKTVGPQMIVPEVGKYLQVQLQRQVMRHQTRLVQLEERIKRVNLLRRSQIKIRITNRRRNRRLQRKTRRRRKEYSLETRKRKSAHAKMLSRMLNLQRDNLDKMLNRTLSFQQKQMM